MKKEIDFIENLGYLAIALRNPAQWPVGFEWERTSPRNSALRLLYLISCPPRAWTAMEIKMGLDVICLQIEIAKSNSMKDINIARKWAMKRFDINGFLFHELFMDLPTRNRFVTWIKGSHKKMADIVSRRHHLERKRLKMETIYKPIRC